MLTQRICNGLIIFAISITMFYTTKPYATNININFSGFIKPGSCEVDLDRSFLQLDNVDYLTLKSGNALLSINKFIVNVHNCYLLANTILRPAIQIDGEGFYAGTKFFFQSSDSSARGIGALLYQGDDAPQYEAPSLKTGDYIDLGGSGSVPEDIKIPFYVGISCGSVSDCNSVDVTPGKMVARIIFNFRYY